VVLDLINAADSMPLVVDHPGSRNIGDGCSYCAGLLPRPNALTLPADDTEP
jgi:hypothetical protein